MPSRPKNKRQPTAPTERPVLRISQAEAEAKLTERIRLGQVLLQGTFFHSPELGADKQEEALWREAQQWHDYNSTWLRNNLGNEVREEYQAVAGQAYRDTTSAYSRNRDREELLKVTLPEEISKLESIRERLPLRLRH